MTGDQLIEDLTRLLGPAGVLTDPAALAAAARDEGGNTGKFPAAVVSPSSEEEVSRVLAYADVNRVPVTPRGAGTSLHGQAVGRHGGLSLDLARMTGIIELSTASLSVRVEPGLRRRALNDALRPTNLFMPVDPGADATLGGMASTRSSGTTTVRYGTFADQVLGLRVVLASGEVICVGSGARKSSGPDLRGLFLGAEGALGIITSLTLKLHPVPRATVSLCAGFSGIPEAISAALAVLGAGLPVARLELLDATAIEALAKVGGPRLPPRPHLWIELHETSRAIADLRLAEVQGVLAAFTTDPGHVATTDTERDALWRARHEAYWALALMHPSWAILSTDVAAPLGRLAESIDYARRTLSDHGFRAPILGHVGDGSYHALLAFDPKRLGAREAAEAAVAAIEAHAVTLGGAPHGEHGLGRRGGARPAEVFGPGGAAAWRAVKHALDPNGILNPGQGLSAEEGSSKP